MKFLWDINPWLLKPIFLTLTLSFFLVSSGYSQNTQALEKKKQKVEQNIKHTQEKIENTKKSKESTLKDYNKIQKKIEVRKDVISGVQSEIKIVQVSLSGKNDDIIRLENQISKLKYDYGNIMKSAYKASLLTNEWMLILSSTSMNQAFHRWLYLKKIKKDRKQKAAIIIAKQLELESELSNLELIKSGKQLLLKKEQNQSDLLSKDLQDKDKLLANLSKDEKYLITTLNRQQKQQRAIASDIEKAIRREIARKEKEARELAERERKKEAARLAAIEAAKAKAAADNEKPDVGSAAIDVNPVKSPDKKPVKTVSEKKEVAITETPKSAALSADFQSNKGNLVWPVGRGVIIKRFGTQAHPDLSHVTIVNNGIDIKTETNAKVNAVFEGEVVHIAFLSGYKNTVMINHGKYYTIYSNLESVAVSKGQKLNTGDMVGIAAVNTDSGNTEVHFELWNKENPLNPAIWLKK